MMSDDAACARDDEGARRCSARLRGHHGRVVWRRRGGGVGGERAIALCGSQLVVLGFGVQVCVSAWGCTAPFCRGEESSALGGQLRG
jgi:hypothetical protein